MFFVEIWQFVLLWKLEMHVWFWKNLVLEIGPEKVDKGAAVQMLDFVFAEITKEQKSAKFPQFSKLEDQMDKKKEVPNAF